MSEPFKYENQTNRLDIKPSVDPKDVFLWVHEGREQAAIHIPNADVPTVAAELLKAAGQEGVFVAKSQEEVVELGKQLECGVTSVTRTTPPHVMRQWAADYIALAEYIENKAQRETEAATKLQERRDALLSDLQHGYKYEALGTHAPMRLAIDRIIELEDKQAA